MSIPRLPPDQAAERMYAALKRQPAAETVAVQDARGRFLANPVSAPVNLPPFDASAMDGYAYDSQRCDPSRPLKIVGRALAGHPFNAALESQSCVRITTGAPLPTGADTVVVQEDTTAEKTQLRVREWPAAGANVRKEGQEVQSGDQLLKAGARLSAFHCGWLAACGLAEVRVATAPTIAIFSTGDELTAPGQTLEPGQIYDSNRLLVQSLLALWPVVTIDGGLLPDNLDTLSKALTNTAADLLVTSGGVSVGDADYLTQLLKAQGELDFWQLNLKPGKPLAFGRLGAAAFLGLPGNPVSTAVTALLFLPVAIAALSGAPMPERLRVSARLTTTIERRGGREEYQRGHCHLDNDTLLATVNIDQSSNRLSSFATANCLIHLPAEVSRVEAGATVEVFPLHTPL